MRKLFFQPIINVFIAIVVIYGTAFGANAQNTDTASSANTGVASLQDTNASGSGNGNSTTSTPRQISSSQPTAVNLQQLPSLIDIPQTPESIERVIKLEEEGEALFKQHLLEKALAKWQEAYGLSIEMKYSEGEGRALTNMARIFLEHGQFVKAKYMGENAVEVLVGVTDKKALGRAHLYLAEAYFGLDNPVWAGEQLDAAMKVFSSDSGNNAADTANLMAIAAHVLLKLGKLKEALQFLQAAAMYSGQAGDNTACISSRIQVVDVLLALGLSTAAEEEAEKAVSVARTAPDQLANLCAALSCYANCKVALGEYNQARKNYEQVLAYCKKVPKEQLNNLARANIYLGYGTTLSALHKFDLAKQVLEIALPVFKAAGASFCQAQAANTLGLVEYHLGHEINAKELIAQSLDLHNLIMPKQDAFRVTVLTNLACLESHFGQNGQSKIHFIAAAELLRKAKETTLLGRVETAIAETDLKLAEETQAASMINDAIKLSQTVSDDSALWREYVLLAKVQLDQNDIKGARESLLSAASFFRSPQAGSFPSPEHLDYPNTRSETAYQLVYLLAQQKFYEQALLACDQMKQEAFLNDWYSKDQQVTGLDTDLYNDLVIERAHLHAAEVSSSPDKIVREWQDWLGRFRTMTAHNKPLARLIVPMSVTMIDVARTLQTNHSTIFDYLVGPDSIMLFTVNPAGNISATSWGLGASQLNTQINTLWSTLSHQGNQADTVLTTQLLHRLYDQLFPSAVQPLLPTDDKQVLTIIPDGALFNLPFAALTNKQGKCLINNYAIVYNTNLATTVSSPPRYTDEKSYLFAGASAEDLKAIASGLPSSAVTFLNGESAMKDLPDEARGKTVIHIANKLDFGSIDTVLPTGMACDLLVLSDTEAEKWNKNQGGIGASDTAVQKFINSGARNVLISLWHRPLNETTELWQDFYGNSFGGANTANALRKMQENMIARGESPTDWAQLQLYGCGY